MIDSMSLSLAQQQMDMLLDQAEQLINNSTGLNQALDLCEQALTALHQGVLAGQPYLRGRARALLLSGTIYFYRADYDETYHRLTEALSLYEQVNEVEGTARTLGVMGATCRQIGDLAGAQEIYHRQLAMYRSQDDEAGESRSLNGLAQVHSQLNEPHKALNYLLEALEIARKQNNTYGIATILGNACHEYLKLEKYDRALDAGRESLSLFTGLQDYSINAAQSYLYLAQVHRQLGRLDEALDCTSQALAISREHTLNSHRLQALHEQGQIFVLRGQADRAFAMFQRVLDEARALNAEASFYSTHLDLVSLYKATGNYEKALYHHEAYHHLREQIFNDDNHRRIHALEVKFRAEAARKEAEFYRQRNVELEALHQKDRDYFERLNHLKDELIRNTSHDLKSPLGGISTTVFILEKYGRVDDERGKSYLERIKQLAQRMAQLLQDVVDVAKLETGRSIERSLLLLNPLLTELQHNFASIAQTKGVVLEIQPAAAELLVMADLRRIRQVLQTLTFNAIRVTPKDGRVIISTASNAEQITISVQDGGAGILDEDLPHVFDRFYRVRQPNKETLEGIGLGLAMAKTIIEQHDGTIHVTGEPDKGCRFWFTLPVATSEGSAP